MPSQADPKSHNAAVQRLADAIEAVARRLNDKVKTGHELARLQERTKLLAELVKELERILEDAVDAQDAELIATTLIERARRL